MKKVHKRLTRKQRDRAGDAPQLHTCNRCNAFKGTRYQVKVHREFCNG